MVTTNLSSQSVFTNGVEDTVVGYWWHPISCSLHLMFCAPTSEKNGNKNLIEAGSPYKGFSKIRYRKMRVTQKEWLNASSKYFSSDKKVVSSVSGDKHHSDWMQDSNCSLADAVLKHVPAQREQVRRQQVKLEKQSCAFPSSPGTVGGGLHLHAYTTNATTNTTPGLRSNSGDGYPSFSRDSLRRKHTKEAFHSNATGPTKNETITNRVLPVFPLQVERYQLTCLQIGEPTITSGLMTNDSFCDSQCLRSCASENIPDIQRGEKLKIIAVLEEEQEEMTEDFGGNAGDSGSNINKSKRACRKDDSVSSNKSSNNSVLASVDKGLGQNKRIRNLNHNGNEKNNNAGRTVGEREIHSSGTPVGEADMHGRMIYFLGEPSLGEGAEVELLVRFTAFVQHHANGGLFIADTSLPNTSGRSERGSALLTHFEVYLARLAFPCPDHPTYRLWWTLDNIQLPDYFAGGSKHHIRGTPFPTHSFSNSSSSAIGAKRTYQSGYCYSTFFTNAPCKERIMLPHQRAVQYRFTSFGPLPAYLLAMAAFTHPLSVIWGFVPLQPPSTLSTTPSPSVQSDFVSSSSPSLLVRVLSTVPCDLPHVFSTTTDAIQQLQRFFASPLPLLVEGVTDVLWEAEEDKWSSSPSQPPQEENAELSSSYDSILTVLVAPTMPFISGMEHHGLICLKDALYLSSHGSTPSCSSSSNVVSQTRKEQENLILHEVAHHWLGNAIGMPFSIKEGLCQWLEQYRDKLRFSHPLKERKSDNDVHDAVERKKDAKGQQRQDCGSLKTSVFCGAGSIVTNPIKGKEFTFGVYRSALLTILHWSEAYGIDVVLNGLRELTQKYLVQPMRKADKEGRGIGGGAGGLFTDEDPCTGAIWPSAPYLSSEMVCAAFGIEAQ